MFAFSIDTVDIKIFMNKLFIQNTFDRLNIRDIKLKTIVTYNIDCTANEHSLEQPKERFVRWSDVKGFIYALIKGNRKPSYMKFIFSLAEEDLETINDNAAAAFINIIYENDKISGYAGVSQKVFSLGKDVEYKWDKMVEKFLKKNEIPFT